MQKKIILLTSLFFLIGCKNKELKSEILFNHLPNDKIEDQTVEVTEPIYWYQEAEITTEFMSINDRELGDRIDTFLVEEQFNGVVLVAIEDRIIILNGYGLANFEEEIPMSVNTQFQIGSVSKPFLGISILQLVEAGMLSLDQTMNQFFPDLEKKNEMTVHDLLVHSSGLNSGDGLAKYSLFTTPEELISYAFESSQYHREPGFVSYSNLGYDMLGVIVEKVSGLTYEDYIQKNIIAVAQMNDSGLNITGGELANLATAYAGHITQGDRAAVFHPSFGYASGGLHATAMDLFKFSQALYNGTLLAPESYQLMTTPHTMVNGTDYGYGWFINARDQQDVLSHNGDLLGWHSILLHHQENKFTVALLTNQSASLRNANMGHAIVNMVLEEIN